MSDPGNDTVGGGSTSTSIRIQISVFLPPVNEVAGCKCFHRCLSVCLSFCSEWGGTHVIITHNALGHGHPVVATETRAAGKRAVRILLKCFLVFFLLSS